MQTANEGLLAVEKEKDELKARVQIMHAQVHKLNETIMTGLLVSNEASNHLGYTLSAHLLMTLMI